MWVDKPDKFFIFVALKVQTATLLSFCALVAFKEQNNNLTKFCSEALKSATAW